MIFVLNLRLLTEKRDERFLNLFLINQNIFSLIIVWFGPSFHLLSSTHAFYIHEGFSTLIMNPTNVPSFRFSVLSILYKA